ncbi:DUF6233 domain-containing protein [Streptomyces canus]|uniref:DUF6233 domain-containing protein n=1 Tax=Streptomyces canus TaxID=58343 RepID=UPI0033BB32E8
MHAGNCHMAGKRHRPVDRSEARRLLAAGLEACTHCRPDAQLHIIDLAAPAGRARTGGERGRLERRTAADPSLRGGGADARPRRARPDPRQRPHRPSRPPTPQLQPGSWANAVEPCQAVQRDARFSKLSATRLVDNRLRTSLLACEDLCTGTRCADLPFYAVPGQATAEFDGHGVHRTSQLGVVFSSTSYSPKS